MHGERDGRVIRQLGHMQVDQGPRSRRHLVTTNVKVVAHELQASGVELRSVLYQRCGFGGSSFPKDLRFWRTVFKCSFEC